MLGRANKLVTHRAYNFVPWRPYQFKCEGISVDNSVGFRIDDQDSGLHAIEDGLELLAIFAQRSLRVVEFRPELRSRRVAGLPLACQR